MGSRLGPNAFFVPGPGPDFNSPAATLLPLVDVPGATMNPLLHLTVTMLDGNSGTVSSSAEDLGPMIKAILWGFIGASGFFLALRIYSKKRRRGDGVPRGLYWDDWVLAFAWLALLGNGVFAHLAVDLGSGRHAYAIDRASVPDLALTSLISFTFALAGQAWSKTSSALTLLRFTKPGVIRKFVVVNTVLMNLFFVAAVALFWFQCLPMHKVWRPSLEGSCLDLRIIIFYSIAVSAYAGAMDLILAALPWKVLKGIEMNPQEKVAVILAMSLGVFAGIAAFVKCSYLPTLLHGDVSFNAAPLVIWGAAETAAVIMAMSIPVMRPLIRDITATIWRRQASGRMSRQRRDSSQSPRSDLETGKSDSAGGTEKSSSWA